jgi:cytochrome c biogenesis protein CcmG/thiol:disulfide interchange protein DsbE
MKSSTFSLKTILPLLIFFGVAVFLWQGLRHDPHQIPSPFINKPLPQFSAEDLFSHQIISNDLFKGHVSVLNVFATWCLSCQAEHPILMDMHQDARFAIYGLNYKDAPNKTLKWLNQEGNPYQRVISDPHGELGINLGVYGTPETFVIDQQGRVRYKYIGPISPTAWQDDIKPVIEHLLQGKA